MNSPEATAPPLPERRNVLASAQMAAAAFGFATMSCIAHGFAGQVAWAAVACSRIALTMALMIVLMLATRTPFIVRGTRALWCRSFFGACGLMTTFYAVTHLPLADAITILSTAPIWMAVILNVFFGEKSPAHVWLHAALAVAGVYVMQRPSFDAESLPLLITVLGAILIASAKVSLSFCRNLPSLAVVTHYATCATIITGLMCLFGTETILLDRDFPAAKWLWLLPMGIAGTLAQILLTRAYALGTATTVALVGLVQIAFAALYGLLIWGESFDVWKCVGVLMIVCSIAFSVLTSAKPARDANPVGGT